MILALLLCGAVVFGIFFAPRMVQEDDVRESVFRYMFEHNYSSIQQKANAYYLGIGASDRDPNPSLLRRFRRNKPQVKPISACELDADGVRDVRTRAKGLVFRIEKIKWVGRDEVEVYGGYFEGGLSSSGSRYRVKRENGRWVVKADHLVWIS
jgi:hypothetical protein